MRDQTRKLITALGPSALWLSGALGLVLFAWTLTRLSQRFGYDWAVYDMPVLTLTALLVTAGVFFFAAVVLAKLRLGLGQFSKPSIALAIMIAAGLAARIVLFASEPALEDDYQRYFWDGAVVAHGVNPYQTAPQAVIDAGPDHSLANIARQSGPVLQRVNHKHLTTIYPPLAQTAFAIAHFVKPFSLMSWRSVVLVFDVATLALILALLAHLNKSLLWSAVYWWNPIVLKEFFNSAHMDALILPFVLGALYLAIKARPISATVAVGCAVGTKVWPIVLAPLIWRHAIENRRQVLVCAAVLAGMCAIWLMPYLAVGLGENSGTASYAQRWTINSPFFTTVRSGLRWMLSNFADPVRAAEWASLSARALMALIAGVIALGLTVKPTRDATDFLTRALIIVAAVIFLAPAIYPWYTLWMAPLLALVPQLALLLLYATIPLYYSYFHFAAREVTNLYQNGMVWIVWSPVWLACLLSWRSSIRIPQRQGAHKSATLAHQKAAPNKSGSTNGMRV